jgi:3-deoxy-7-phosphoheptulonate synthase
MLRLKQQINSNSYSSLLKISEKSAWNPESWQKFIALQQPIYEDQNTLLNFLSSLKKALPLVPFDEVEELKQDIYKASIGQKFILQMGDCAEQFKDCNLNTIKLKLTVFSKLKELLELGLNKKIIPIGRIAGQFAKPRSDSFETKGNLTLPAYRGDIIHSSEFNEEARKINPINLLNAYKNSKRSLHYIKRFFKTSPFYTSHEALLLHYESSLTRYYIKKNSYYNSSAHFLWVGERTRQLGGAHIKYLSGIMNPIGIKFSEHIRKNDFIKTIAALNPKQENGKIILIPRMGSEKISAHLPGFIRTAKKEDLNVTWMCDPMHGNTEKTSQGIKTRKFENICNELIQTIKIHKAENSCLGGIHLETAAEEVTECTGGFQKITEQDLKLNYKSACDPRLNPTQCNELLSYFINEIVRK